ncbi:MAG: hypothetical protein H0V88_10240 [Pyrinomonadaceae bacterium]|nr:hypothetical protein [Pyrinomonadaceae bacterium]
MSQNKNDDPMNRTGANTGARPGTGGAGTGATDAGTTRDTSTGGTTGMTRTSTATPAGASGGQGGAAAGQGMAAQAQQYGQKIADAATTAKDYMSDKLSTAGDKIKDLQNVDVKQVAEDAKQYARQNPGQALLISAAAGFLLGIVLRGSRR